MFFLAPFLVGGIVGAALTPDRKVIVVPQGNPQVCSARGGFFGCVLPVDSSPSFAYPSPRKCQFCGMSYAEVVK